MFPYQRKNDRAKKLNKTIKMAVSNVKSYYFHAYDTIIELVQKENYKIPNGYTKKQWNQAMVKLQCYSFMKLKNAVDQGYLSQGQISNLQLSYLNGYDSSNQTPNNWSEIYLNNFNQIEENWKSRVH